MATDVQKEQQAQSLPDVLARTFAARDAQGFAERFVGLVAALLNVAPVALFTAPFEESDDAPKLVASTAPLPDATFSEAAAKAFAAEKPVPMRQDDKLTARVALPDGAEGALVLTAPQGSNITLALAHERLATLQVTASARFSNPDIRQLTAAMASAQALSDPMPEAMQAFVDHLVALTDADHAALAHYDGDHVTGLVVSGQGKAATRSTLKDALARDLKEIGRKKIMTATRRFMGADGQDHGLVLALDGATRNAPLVPLIAAAVSAAAPPARAPRHWRKRIVKWSGVALILAGVALCPLPDGVQLNARVEAQDFRVVTAPISASVGEISVADGARVEGGKTALLRMDTSEITSERIAAQADYAAALLARETARVSRDAAALRNAELEAERIAARVTLLEIQEAAATLVAPITGVIIAPDLASQRGAVLTQGTPLLQIADPAKVALDVDILQADLARVSPGMAGRFQPDFDPSLSFNVTLSTVSPAALPSDRAPVFSARAEIIEDSAQLRHGMTGILQLDRKWTPAGLLVWEALRDWALLRLWL